MTVKVMTKIKICGITNLEDALLAAELRVDMLGFIFVPSSPRRVEPEAAKEIIAQLPSAITKVGVFVNQELDYIRHVRRLCGLDVVQLHGEESPDFCQQLGGKIVKAIRVKDEASLEPMKGYSPFAFLLDAYQPGKHGGTGKTFNWELAVEAKRYGQIILSGGLKPENVREAICQVQPYAVDVASGVEAATGKKDPQRLREFVRHLLPH